MPISRLSKPASLPWRNGPGVAVGWGVILFCRFGFVQIRASDAPCPRHFTTPTSALTEKLYWLVCYFAQRSWQSAFLRENNPTIITSFGKLTGWFAMLAHRRQLTNRPKEKPPEGGSSTQNLLQRLAHGEEAMARRTGQRRLLLRSRRQWREARLCTAGIFPQTRRQAIFPQPALCRLLILILEGS